MKASVYRLLAGFAPIAILMLSSRQEAMAQAFSHADSGWVNIWNGKDWKGADGRDSAIYSRKWGANAPMSYPPISLWEIRYPGTDTATIRVTSTGNDINGNIGTRKTSYSHYRMRVQGKFDVMNGDYNAGITYHTDETKSRMSNNWPRSIEFQMQQKEPGSAYSIQQLTFDTKVSGSNYSPTGNAVTACESGPSCNSRQYYSNPRLKYTDSDGKSRWLRFELVARGSDSAIHIINDTVVFRLSNLRVYNDKANNTPDGPVDHGGIGLQAEGALVNYRRWEIMEFPAGTPKGENYLHRFFLDNLKQGATVKAGSPYEIKWRHIGPIPTVTLDYSIGNGAWQSIVKDAPNTGSYSWNVPTQKTEQLKVRLTGPAWAAGDSSTGFNAIGDGVGILSKPRLGAKTFSFSVAGKGVLLADIAEGTKIEICDVFGRVVERMAVKEADLAWNARGSNGRLMPSGIYFVRVLDRSSVRVARTFVY